MSYHRFLDDLFDTGKVAVSRVEAIPRSELGDGNLVLKNREPIYRSIYPLEPPSFDFNIASWAAEYFYFACSLFCDQDAGIEVINRRLKAPNIRPTLASHHYSVDLVFRYMLSLMNTLKKQTSSTPLVESIQTVLNEFPLSAIGCDCDCSHDQRDLVLNHPSLRLFYIERVIDRREWRSLDDDRITNELKRAAGDYPHLVERFETERAH